MKITPVNKLPDFDGPKTHNEILKKIHQEAIEEGKDIPFSYIYRTVYLFFGQKGFPYYFRQYISFIIPGLGRWNINRHGIKYKKKLILIQKRKQYLANKKYLKKIHKHKKVNKSHKKVRKFKKIFDWDTMKLVNLK